MTVIGESPALIVRPLTLTDWPAYSFQLANLHTDACLQLHTVRRQRNHLFAGVRRRDRPLDEEHIFPDGRRAITDDRTQGVYVVGQDWNLRGKRQPLQVENMIAEALRADYAPVVGNDLQPRPFPFGCCLDLNGRSESQVGHSSTNP